MEKRRLMDLARVVTDNLLLVGTSSKGAVASIDAAHKLLIKERWCSGEADDPGCSSSSSHGGGVPLNTTCDNFAGLSLDDAGPLSNSAGGSCHDVGGVPWNTMCDTLAGLCLDDAGPLSSSEGSSCHGVGGVSPSTTTCDSPALGFDDAGAPSWVRGSGGPDVGGASSNTTGGNLLNTAVPPKELITKAYTEITRLLALHGEAGHVFVHCATRLGIQQGGAHNLGGGGQADNDASWARWRDLRQSFIRHAHTVLLRLSDATSAAAAIADVTRLQQPAAESRRRFEFYRSVATNSLAEAETMVRLMEDAVLREYFETCMILSRA